MILRHEPACVASGCRYRDTRRSYAVTPDTVLDFWFGALRGAVLGRKSTAEERAYLQASGQHFGQG
ncbi:MAG: hypothetical protein OXU61_04230 [Gammaproteobacteria bacterium]|nr:hypothetical protein [Gammaproteobacteria bacterium]